MNFLKFNKIVITKVALISNVRKLILYIEYTCRHAVASSSKQVLPVNSFIYIYTNIRPIAYIRWKNIQYFLLRLLLIRKLDLFTFMAI